MGKIKFVMSSFISMNRSSRNKLYVENGRMYYVRYAHVIMLAASAPSAYSPQLTRGQHAARPVYISV